MTDIFSVKKRSWIMARIHSRDTQPELFVRSVVHRMGFRFRLGGAGLPGKPDLVFPRMKKALFVHGCFWHCHNCRRASVPTSNTAFWKRKLLGNAQRDNQNYRKLKALGWSYLVVWQCELRKENRLLLKLKRYLEERKTRG
jgi:DNA mismatch endonuclease, patch repair protein